MLSYLLPLKPDFHCAITARDNIKTFWYYRVRDSGKIFIKFVIAVRPHCDSSYRHNTPSQWFSAWFIILIQLYIIKLIWCLERSNNIKKLHKRTDLDIHSNTMEIYFVFIKTFQSSFYTPSWWYSYMSYPYLGPRLSQHCLVVISNVHLISNVKMMLNGRQNNALYLRETRLIENIVSTSIWHP